MTINTGSGDGSPQRSRLDEVESTVRAISWGVDHETADLRAALEDLAHQVQKLTAAPPEPKPAPEPKAWVDDATAQQWTELAGWVDWLVSTYDLLMSRSVLPCWPAHLGVVEELAALRGAWRAAATAARIKEPNDALAQWHDGLLHPCLLRLRQAFQQKSCEDRHTTPRAGHTTDVDLLAPALAAAARRPAPSGKLPG